MDYRNLGRTGLKVSALCLGTMQFGWTADEPTSFEVLDAAYEAGLTFLDTADVYSRWVDGHQGGEAETIIGKWMHSRQIPRESVIIATKVKGKMGEGPNDQGLSRVHILQAVENSLRRLGTDYIDLYQTHSYDAGTPIDETLGVMNDLVRQGKVRYVGCSNYPAWRLMESLWVAERYNLARFDSLQPHYNLVHRAEFEAELRDVCRTYGLGVIPYSPLAAGFLTGKYRRGQEQPESARKGAASRYFNDKNWDLLEQMETLGQELGGYSISQLALAWMLADPVITSPIIGPRNLDQLNDNLRALEVGLSPDAKLRLDEASAWQKR